MSWIRLCAVGATALAGVTGCQSCVDLNRPLQYPCAPDAGTLNQCPLDWRCGLEGYCHGHDAGAYQCVSDSDCEGGWRCGLGGVCVDVSGQALVPTHVAGNPAVAAFENRPLQQLPDAVASSVSFQFVNPCNPAFPAAAQSVSWVSQGQVFKQVIIFNGLPLDPTGSVLACDAGADPGALVFKDLRSAALGGGAIDLVDEGDSTWALLDGGALCRYSWEPFLPLDAGCPTSFAGSVRQLRASQIYDGQILGLASTSVSVFTVASNSVQGPYSIKDPVLGTLPIFDAIILPADVQPLLLAATDAGFYAATLNPTGAISRYADGGPWAPVGMLEFNNLNGQWLPKSPNSPNDPVHQLRWSYGPTNTLWARETEYGAEQVKFFHPFPTPPPDSGISLPSDVNAIPGQGGMIWGHSSADFPVQICRGPVDTLYPASSFHPVFKEDGGIRIWSLCELGSAVVPDIVESFGNGGVTSSLESGVHLPQIPLYQLPLIASRSDPMTAAYASSAGHLWINQVEDNSGQLIPLFVDRAPDVVSGDDAGLWIALPPVTPLAEVDELSTNFASAGRLPLQPLFSDFGSNAVLASVDGEARGLLFGTSARGGNTPDVWLLLSSAFAPTLPILGQAAVDAPLVAEPIHAALAPTRDGRTLFVMSSFDSLMAADITALIVNPDAGAIVTLGDAQALPKVQVTLVPLNKLPITSLVAVAPGNNSTAIASGFLVIGGRVFEFQQTTEVVWRADEISVGNNTAIDLWTDGVNAWAGLVDGTVLSLPNRVPLVSALPSGAGAAVTFASVCRQTFALAQNGLYRAIIPTAGIGRWESVQLPSFAAAGIAWPEGKLFASSQTLYLFTGLGPSFTLDNLECP